MLLESSVNQSAVDLGTGTIVKPVSTQSITTEGIPNV